MIFRPNSTDQKIYKSVFEDNEYQISPHKILNTVVDVGAHIGSFSRLVEKMGAKNVFSFEPNLDSYNILVQNLGNAMHHPYQLAVRGNYDHTAVRSAAGAATMSKNIINYGGIVIGTGSDADVITLEDILKMVGGYINLLKLDCEGSEYPIIFDSDPLIFRYISTIVGEYHPGDLPINHINGSIKTSSDFIEKLKDLGYYVVSTTNHTDSRFGKFTATR